MVLIIILLSGSKKIRLLQSTARRLRKQLHAAKKEACKTPQQVITAAAKYLDPKVCDFFRTQLLNSVKHKKGRRYEAYERKFALALFYHSPKAYRFLQSFFILPSVSTVHLWLKVCLNSGWSKHTLAVLNKRAEALPKEETLCGIVFDAMSLKESLHFDQASDSIIGREDFGEQAKVLSKQTMHLFSWLKGWLRYGRWF